MVMIHRKKSDNYDRSIGQTGNDTLSWVQTDETFSGVITYRVSQTNRLVIMTTNRSEPVIRELRTGVQIKYVISVIMWSMILKQT